MKNRIYKKLLGIQLMAILLLSSCGPEIILNEFPGQDFEKVVAYKLLGDDSRVIEKGKLNQVIGEGEVLSQNEIESLLAIMHDKSTYGEVGVSCFNPHVGYVFYGKKKEVIAHATICLSCISMLTTPDIGEFVISQKGSKRLWEFEESIFEDQTKNATTGTKEIGQE